MGKKSKNKHRRETLREAVLRREKDLDQQREARREKREHKLVSVGLEVPVSAAAADEKRQGAMVVVVETAAAREPTLRKKGTTKRTANFAKTGINRIGVRKALPQMRKLAGGGIAKKEKHRGLTKLMKKQKKRMEKKSGMDLG